MTKFMTVVSIGLISAALVGCSAPPPDAALVTDISQETLQNDPPADALILDVRTPGEYDAGHVPDAMNIPHDQLSGRLSELEAGSDRAIVVYCKSGKRAGIASSILLDAGYANVLHLVGDMDGWKAAGLPMESNEAVAQ